MHDKLPPTDNEYLKALSSMICAQYENLNEKLDRQGDDIKSQLLKSDAHFEKRLDKLETKVEKIQDEHKESLVQVATVQTQTKGLTGTISAIVGVISSVVVTFLAKVLGF